jgi:hypothetical protein
MLPSQSGPHGRHGRSPFRFRPTPAALFVGLVLVTSAHSADPSSLALSDVALARKALAAVDADPQLREANLVVSVVDRVAVLGGPVPNADASRRAESLVGQIPGIAAVKNRCFVQVEPGSLLRAIAEPLPPFPRRPFLTDLPGVLPGAGWNRIDDDEGGFAMVEPGANAVVVRRPSNPAENILMAPVGPRAGLESIMGSRPFPPVPRANLTSVPPVPAPVVVPVKPRDARSAAEAIREADPRFAGLRVELVNGTMLVTGTARRSPDAWDLAEALREIPGVARVALGRIDVK